MSRCFFTVGHVVALCGIECDNVLSLEVLGAHERTLGTVTVEMQAHFAVVRTDVRNQPRSSVSLGEVASLAAGLARRNLGAREVRDERGHPLDIAMGDVGPKAKAPHEIYRDPFTVPWNFVPAEMEIYADLLTRPHLSVLDVGCGYGKNALWLLRAGHDVVGLDISTEAVQRCRDLLGHRGTFLVGDVACGLPHEGFDVALDVGCLHCMPADRRPSAVEQLRRCISPTGVLRTRIFKPRPDGWLRRQPFVASSFGLADDEVAALFQTWSSTTQLADHEDYRIMECRP